MLIHIAGSGVSTMQNIESSDIQPNAIDLRIGDIWSMSGPFYLMEDDKIHRDKSLLEPGLSGSYLLEPGAYEISFNNIVSMSDDEAGFVIPRSTLNRNGLFITSGLYDSGYTGALAACLHVRGGTAYIEKNARVAQFLLFKAEALHSYNGSYGFNPDGTPKAEEIRYHA